MTLAPSVRTPFERAETLSRSLAQRAWFASTTAVIFVGVFIGSHPKRFAAPHALPPAPTIEAELVKPEEHAHLHSSRETAAPARETKVSVSGRGHVGSLLPLTDAKNETTVAPPAPKSHGAVVLSSPAPKIPPDLKNEVFKTSVLIEFFVSADGSAQATLIGSSGNDELDALALTSARSWVFRPAEKDGVAMDSKVRLRVNFEVE